MRSVLSVTIGFILEAYIVIQLWRQHYQGFYAVLFVVLLIIVGLAYIRSPFLYRFVNRSYLHHALILIVILGTFFIVNRINLTNWYYTAIGDEYAFWNLAQSIAHGTTPNIFSQEGVYSLIPVASSYYQAAVMRIFGINYVGWKMSGIIIAMASIVSLYVVAHLLFHRSSVSVVSTIIMASSHYLWAYARTGYSNIESLFPALASLALGLLGVHYQSSIFYYLCGVMAGIGFYTFYPSRLTIALVVILLWLRRREIHFGKSIFIVLVGFCLVTAPLIATSKTNVIASMLSRSITHPYPQTHESALTHFISNMSLSFKAFIVNRDSGPYVSGSLVDPVTGALLVTGFILFLPKYRKYPWNFLFIWYTAGLVVCGGLSQYHFVSISRLFWVLPVVALFSANSLILLLGIMGRKMSRYNSVLFLGSVIALSGIFVSNIYRFFIQTPHTVPATREALAVRAVQLSECRARSSIVIAIDPHGSPLYYAFPAMELSPMPYLVSPDEYTQNMLFSREKLACFIFIHWDNTASKRIIQNFMSTNGNGNIHSLVDESQKTTIMLIR